MQIALRDRYEWYRLFRYNIIFLDLVAKVLWIQFRSIAEALGIELTRTVEWTATIEVSGTIELDLLEDYDIEDEITDNLYVDSQSGRIEIGDQEVCHVREC